MADIGSKIPSASSLLKRALVFGAVGWGIENVFARGRWGRYSKHLGGRRRGLPFLPVYAAGGVLVGLIAPRISNLPAPARAAVYSGALSLLELGACRLDRKRGRAQWRYRGDALASESRGCVDLPHALAWSALGLIAEQLNGQLEQHERA